MGKFLDLSKKMYLTKSNTARPIVTSYTKVYVCKRESEEKE